MFQSLLIIYYAGGHSIILKNGNIANIRKFFNLFEVINQIFARNNNNIKK